MRGHEGSKGGQFSLQEHKYIVHKGKYLLLCRYSYVDRTVHSQFRQK